MHYAARMSRIAKTLPVTPKMYRNFAVVTVVITGFIAIFADGENKAYVEDQIAQAKKTNSTGAKVAKASDETKGGLRVRDNGAAAGSFGADSGSDGGGGSNSFSSGDSPSGTTTPRRRLPPQMRPKRLADGRSLVPLSPDDQGNPLPMTMANADQTGARPDERASPEQIEAMIEASRARSGGD